MESYYRCEFFEQDSVKGKKDFLVVQDEIAVHPEEMSDQNLSSINNKKIRVVKDSVEYQCELEVDKSFDSKKPTIIITLHDDSDLLKYTLNNLQENNIYKHCNIFIVDDRSEEDLKNITIENGASYLRIDKVEQFNFSMLNNIAAKICHDYGNKEVIFWNSDLWCVDEEYFLSFVKRHKESKSKVSGSKLVYPPLSKSINKDVDTKNINAHFSNKGEITDGKWRNTVQYGGDFWILSGGMLRFVPNHFKRFTNIEDPMVNCDKGLFFLTGALQYWDLEYFMEIGGFNPSLAKSFQDVDVCLKVCERGDSPMYFGKDIYFYHDESYTLHNSKKEKKMSPRAVSDHIIFSKIWNDKFQKIFRI